MTGVSIIATMDRPDLCGPWFDGDTWDGWRAVLKAAFALPMAKDEVAFFKSIAGDRELPSKPVRELWVIVGRRGGKDSIASLISAHVAAMFENEGQLRGGERALVACLASDREQSKIVLNFTRSYFTDCPMLADAVTREVATGFELHNGVDVAVATASFRAVRGRPVLCAVLDEIAFWRDESSANPDQEVYRALVPGLASLAGSILVGISSPYRKAGLLYAKYKRHFGKSDDDVLVIQAPTRTLNPTIDQKIIDDALADDPEAAAAEWLAEFRDDVSDYVSREAVEAVVTPDCRERPYISSISYRAFVDPSGGSADSFTLGIGHRERETGMAVLDLVRERKPPFSPEAVVEEYATTLKSYGVLEVCGDRYAGEWPREQFAKRGITYRVSEQTKNDLYRALLPRINSRTVDLLDNPAIITQLCNLERKVARGGRDSIDHGPGGHDDMANVVAGVVAQISDTRSNAPVAAFGRFHLAR